MLRTRIIGPIFFEETITAANYREILNTFIEQLHDDEITTGFFQQDNATAHTVRQTIDYLQQFYDNRLINANRWPPRSPDLTPLDFFLFGYLKNKIFRNRLHTLDELKEAVRIAIGEIGPEMLQNVFEVEHNYYWRDYRGTIPDDAFSGAENLYVAQISSYWLMPGTFDAKTKEAYTEQGKKVIAKNNFKVCMPFLYGVMLLCDLHADNFYWKNVNVNDLVEKELEDLVVGGMELDTPLYVGKTYHAGEWKMGKVFPPTHEFKGLRLWTQTNETLNNITLLLCCYTFAICLAAVEHNYYWRDYMGTIPDDAFNGGENLYVAQIVSYWLMPGTFNAKTKEAYTEQGNKVVMKDNIKLLCDLNTENFYWEQVHISDLVDEELDDLVVGGMELNTTLYIGKAYHDGELQITKIFPPTHKCVNAKKIMEQNFEKKKKASTCNEVVLSNIRDIGDITEAVYDILICNECDEKDVNRWLNCDTNEPRR
ncbi:transposable element tc3 transposase-like protein [Holotrichia oblita]|uniref:Transposable element tc3 transposase-like protein n=1 Tax=Holotrichia oblita TaxID=644536 RepID=A0ACB9SLH7_HOLOL|nr:transposable element tc3 transposase-like protein [Holotrichia oblita]